VVFFSQPLEQKLTWELKCEFIAGAGLLARCGKRLKVSVKPHPRENPDELRRLLEAAGLSPDALLPVELNLDELLSRCAVAATIFSTVGVEALVLGKPVAVLRVPGEEAVLEYTASEGVYRAFNAEELAEGVQRLLRDPELRRKLAAGRRAYLERHEAGADGGAARRVAAVIGELLQDE
jgi:glycosyltransferase involved in cell wall biosynthesis